MTGQATETPTYPPRLLRYTTAITIAAVPVTVAAVVFARRDTFDRDLVMALVVFTLAATLAEAKPVPLDEARSRSVSLAFVFLLTLQVVAGWQWAVLAAIVAMATCQILERIEIRRSLFNVAVYALSAFASALPGHVLQIDGRVLPPAAAARITGLVLADGLVFVAVNVVLIAVAVTLAHGHDLRTMLDDYVRHAGKAFAIMGVIGALGSALWKIDPLLELLLVGPLFALALYQRYAYRTAVAARDAETDALTGVRNHRAYQLRLTDAIELAQPFALAALDIDDFKGVNDRFGHPTGDEVLQLLAETMSALYPLTDIFRVGGEEFAILLTGSDADAASALAAVERLHERLTRVDTPHGERLTVSVGVALWPAMATTRDELIRLVDSALYSAKASGKARSCLYSPDVGLVEGQREITARAERRARLRAAESLVRVVDAKDSFTGAHSLAVAKLATGIARELGLGEDVCEHLRLAGLLHDLGKVGIPDRILQKRGPLTGAEEKIVREHPEIGYRLLDGAGVEPIDLWVRHHHEAWDGSGYPDGLRGEHIPLGARIILVADAFDAMTARRAYRDGRPVREALTELRALRWQQFDGEVVAALERHLERCADEEAAAS